MHAGSVLLIEDEPEIAELLRMYFERESYALLHAESREAGLDLVDRDNITVVLRGDIERFARTGAASVSASSRSLQQAWGASCRPRPRPATARRSPLLSPGRGWASRSRLAFDRL